MRNDLKEIQRRHYKDVRKKILPTVEKEIILEADKVIHNLILDGQLNGYLGLYWPLKNEIDLRHLKVNIKTPIALPASKKNGYLTYHHWNKSPLRRDFCGIPAPLDEPILSANEISLLIVPALAIDQNGYRLGYGGGFYDRLRSSQDWGSIPSLVVLPKACVAKEPLPIDSWDIPFNGWINEDGGFRSVPKKNA